MKEQLELQQHQLQKPLGQGLPKVTYQWEKFSDIMQELPPLFIRHWEEVIQDKGQEPLNIDWQTHFQLEATGSLQIFTVRGEDASLQGYIFYILSPNLNSANTHIAMSEKYFLAPEYRKGFIGYNLIKKSQIGLKNIRVNVIYYQSLIRDKNIDNIMERLGFSCIEKIYSKRL